MTTQEHLYASIKSNPHCSTQSLCQWVRAKEPVVEGYLKELVEAKKITSKKVAKIGVVWAIV